MIVLALPDGLGSRLAQLRPGVRLTKLQSLRTPTPALTETEQDQLTCRFRFLQTSHLNVLSSTLPLVDIWIDCSWGSYEHFCACLNKKDRHPRKKDQSKQGLPHWPEENSRPPSSHSLRNPSSYPTCHLTQVASSLIRVRRLLPNVAPALNG